MINRVFPAFSLTRMVSCIGHAGACDAARLLPYTPVTIEINVDDDGLVIESGYSVKVPLNVAVSFVTVGLQLSELLKAVMNLNISLLLSIKKY